MQNQSPRYRGLQQVLREEPARWLVTGVAGFIGSHLLETLLWLDQEVVGLDNFATGNRANLELVRELLGDERWKKFTLIEGDVTDPAVCARACSGVEFVLHQAALGSVPRSVKDPEASHRANVSGFLTLALAARDAQVRRFVYASSSSVYGDSEVFPRREDSIGRPLSPYAATKRVDEVYADALAKTYGMSMVGLRYFNVFGPRQNPDGAYAAVIPRWIRNRVRGEVCQIFGDGETSRDFCPVENVVQANLLAATINPDGAVEPGHEVYNVALGDQTNLNELYFKLEELIHPGAEPVPPEYAPFREGDVRTSRADTSRAAQRLGFHPETNFRDALKKTVQWYKQHLDRHQWSM
jgi:UDP-N-acetylglucosamine/UDP-N-acetylgalactosamine 4-epimerase